MISTQVHPSASPRVPGWAVWFLRLSTLLVTVFVLLQSVLAGLFVTGEVGMLGLHSANAFLIVLLVIIHLVAAILVWRPGRGPAWPIWAGLTYLILIYAQAGLGYARLVALHIPVGVALFGAAVAMLVGVWSPRTRVRRSMPGREQVVA